MNEILQLVYFQDDALKTLISVIVLSIVFEFVLTFAYIIRSAKSGVK